MIGKEFGIKRACQNCGAKFFDLKKKVPTCPKCGTEFVAVKTRTRKTAAKQEKAVAVVADVPADNKADSEEEALNEIGVDLDVEVDEEEEDEANISSGGPGNDTSAKRN